MRPWRPRTWLAAALVMATPGCSSPAEEPGAVTADEDRQLNEAAAMLDGDSVSLNALSDERNGQ